MINPESCTVASLWSLIGRQVRDCQGKCGRIEKAYVAAWWFVVRWQGSAQAIAVSGADLTLVSESLPAPLDPDPQHLKKSAESWSEFARTSALDEPAANAAMQAGMRDVIGKLEREGRLSGEAEYWRRCSFWWPVGEFEAAAKAAEPVFQQRRHRLHVAELLYLGQIDAADQYFNRFCRAWWAEADYEKKKAEAESKRIQLAEAAAAARVASERTKLKVSVLLMLARGELAEAEALYSSQCSGWWDENEFRKLHEKAAIESAVRAKESLRRDVEALLDAGQFDIADQKYEQECQGWWNKLEYLNARENALARHLSRERKRKAELEEEARAARQREEEAERRRIEAAERRSLRIRELRRRVAMRRIDSLVHFTAIENVQSILERGILCRKLVPSHVVYTDEVRHDEWDDCISTSISFPNYKMFYSKQQSLPSVQGWAVLLISCEVLWEQDCYFTITNAASSGMRRRIASDYASVAAFDAMFSSPEHRVDIPDCFTTDPQAEVLVSGEIPAQYLRGIAVATQRDAAIVKRLGGVPVLLDPSLFTYRKDYAHWRGFHLSPGGDFDGH